MLVTAYNELRASERFGVQGTAAVAAGLIGLFVVGQFGYPHTDDVVSLKVADLPPDSDLFGGDGNLAHPDVPKRASAALRMIRRRRCCQRDVLRRIRFLMPLTERRRRRKKIALSFDDGPDGDEPKILDIWKEEKGLREYFS